MGFKTNGSIAAGSWRFCTRFANEAVPLMHWIVDASCSIRSTYLAIGILGRSAAKAQMAEIDEMAGPTRGRGRARGGRGRGRGRGKLLACIYEDMLGIAAIR